MTSLQNQQRRNGAIILRDHVWTPGQELGAKLLFGGLGCSIAVVFTHPIDVIKTRLQLQGEVVVPSTPVATTATATAVSTGRISGVGPHPSILSTASSTHLTHTPGTNTINMHPTFHRDAGLLVNEPPIKSSSIGGTASALGTTSAAATTPLPRTLKLIPLLRETLRNEGPRVLISGLGPAVLRESIYSAIRFGGYDHFKGMYSGMLGSGSNGGKSSTFVMVLSGLTSGMIGSAIANPTDLIKVRLQAYWPGAQPRYTSIAGAFKSIYTEEGVRGLFRGVVPTCARAMVLTGSQLASYDSTKQWLLRQKDSIGNSVFHEGVFTHMCASTFAGLVCTITSAPLDVCKVRIMNQPVGPNGKGLLYKSMMDCAFKTAYREGPLALYKGFTMCWLRLGPHTMLSLMIFESLRKWVGLNPV
ncbi:hypothetical protein BGZ76_000712 [Entomortierella beljakovae]|nr:hypothetical protein BGZ76_000712 [Entomortierella beljakovae]